MIDWATVARSGDKRLAVIAPLAREYVRAVMRLQLVCAQEGRRYPRGVGPLFRGRKPNAVFRVELAWDRLRGYLDLLDQRTGSSITAHVVEDIRQTVDSMWPRMRERFELPSDAAA